MQSISKGETGPGRSVGHLRRQEAPKYGMVSLNGVGEGGFPGGGSGKLSASAGDIRDAG